VYPSHNNSLNSFKILKILVASIFDSSSTCEPYMNNNDSFLLHLSLYSHNNYY
jgi:hypothetical protein